jgi:hypothetical protein
MIVNKILNGRKVTIYSYDAKDEPATLETAVLFKLHFLDDHSIIWLH